jgi:hypothetical protein
LACVAFAAVLGACASPAARVGTVGDRSTSSADSCLERATILARSASPLPKPDASIYWLSLQRLATPTADGLYAIEAAYREMVLRECRDDASSALPRQR